MLNIKIHVFSLRILPLLCLGLTGCATGQPASRVDMVIESVGVIDVRNGKVLPDRDIVIDQGRIRELLPAGRAARMPAAERIDGRGRYALPGLWDNHVHFGGGKELAQENKNLLPLYVAHGVTTVRDAAGDLSDEVLAWRGQIAAGALLGPTIYTSGPKIEGIDSIWPGDIEVGDETQLRAAFDRLQAMRVDFIKITDNTLKLELFIAALQEAQRRNLTTSAHIPMALTLDEAADAGLDSIEHIDYAVKAGSRDERGISADYRAGRITYAQASERLAASFDLDTAKAAYRRLAAKGVAIDPTLNGSRVVAYLDQDDHADDAYLAYLGPGLKATYVWRVDRAAKDDVYAIAARHQRFEQSAALLPVLRDAGVRILIGTDAGFLNSFNYPGIGLHDEMELYVRYGLTPAQTLRAATLDNAAFLGKEPESGEIVVGKRADLVLLSADPLQDIRATRAIDAVILQGRYLDREALDAMLSNAKVQAAKTP